MADTACRADVLQALYVLADFTLQLSLDGESLCELLKQLRLGVNIETVESVRIDTKWFESI